MVKFKKKLKVYILLFMLLLFWLIPSGLYTQDDLGLDDLGIDDAGGGTVDTTSSTGNSPGGDNLDLEGGTGGGDINLGTAGGDLGGGSSDIGTKSVYDFYYPDKKDPFSPHLSVVRFEEIAERPKIKPTTTTFKPQITKPVIPDISMQIIAIIGNDMKRMALVNFEGKELELTKGYEEPGQFRVTDITEDSVVIYSLRKRRQRIFSLPKD